MSSDKEVPAKRGLLTLGVAVVTGIVGLNTLVVSCSSDQLVRSQEQQRIIDREEEYWRSINNELVEASALDLGTPKRIAKMNAIFSSYESHKATISRPDLHEGKEKMVSCEPQENTPMKNVYTIYLGRCEDFGNLIFLNTADTSIEQNSRRLAEERIQESTAPEVVTKAAEGLALISTRSFSSISEGFDIDVFWCDRGTATTEAADATRANYADAGRIAAFLGETANKHVKYNSQMLGAVRARVLSQQRQTDPGYKNNSTRNRIRWDTPAERELAKELAKAVANMPGGGFNLEVAYSGTPTLWYMGIFACSHGEPPSA